MPDKLVKNASQKGEFNNYLVGGNLCTAFAIGELGTEDDFFLVGADSHGETNSPILTGNILDSDGKLLCRLARNKFVSNPGNCSIVASDHVGYEIQDSAGKLVLKVATRFETLPGDSQSCWLTTLTANFYNKNGELVYLAHSGDEKERLNAGVKAAYGVAGELERANGLNEDELLTARAMLASGGLVHRVISGRLEKVNFTMDGVMFVDAKVRECEITVETGDFFILGDTQFDGCSFVFAGVAMNIKNLLDSISGN